jgi:hypothetical protein
LDQRDGAAVSHVGLRACLLEQKSSDHAVHDLQLGCHQLGLCCQQQAQEAIGQDAALKEGVELVFDELRQVCAGSVFGLSEERRGVLLHSCATTAWLMIVCARPCWPSWKSQTASKAAVRCAPMPPAS